MGTARFSVKKFETLTESECRAYGALSATVWPPDPTKTPVEIAPQDAASRPARIAAFIREGETVIAEAEGFTREIITADGTRMKVLALASVCTHPDHRKQGLASKVVKAVFKRVDDGEYSVCLWQTGVPDFYQTLGARVVENRFHNRQHPQDPAKNPFWDKFIMIYPANAVWPEGDIDLNGLGY